MSTWTPFDALPLPELIWPRLSWRRLSWRRLVGLLVARAARLVWGGLKRW